MYSMQEIEAVDLKIANLMQAELDRQNSHIELIASENWVSKAVMSAMGSALTMQFICFLLIFYSFSAKTLYTFTIDKF